MLRININGSDYQFLWKYEHSTLNQLINDAGLTAHDVKGKSKKELMLLLGVTHLPHPDATMCLMINSENELVDYKKVTRHYKTPFVYAKARYFSFQRLVNHQFPGRHNKEVRRQIWTAYLQHFKVLKQPAFPVVLTAEDAVAETN